MYIYLWFCFLYVLVGLLIFWFTDTYKGWYAGVESFTSDELKSRKFTGILKGSVGSVVLFAITLILFLGYPIFFLIRYLNDEKVSGGLKNNKSAGSASGGIPLRIQSKYKGVTAPSATIFRSPENILNLRPDQVIYLEGDFNPLINNYLTNHYDRFQRILIEIKKYCHIEIEFIYLPRIQSESTLNNKARRILHYYFPWADYNTADDLQSGLLAIRTDDFSRMMAERLNYNGELFSGFLRIRKDRDAETNEFQFAYSKLDVPNLVELEKVLYFYFSHIGHLDSKVFYQLANDKRYYKNGKTYELADFRFNYEAHKLAEEVKAKVDSLVKLGGEHLLLNLFGDRLLAGGKSGLLYGNGLSRLVIERDYRIILPDYDNLEIELTPLPKTIFLFFLRHPEGIVFKHLSDHRDELLKIYQQLSYRETWDEVMHSIDELVDPTRNSINEKCSRIKEAFIKNFEERLAQHYYITGARGGEKGIKLDRKLITWNIDTHMLPAVVPAKSIQESNYVENQTEEIFNAGKMKLNEKKYNQAISLFSQILEKNNYHFNACSMRAIAHFEIGEYASAIEDNDRAIRLNPIVNVAFHNRAEARLMLKDYNHALDDVNMYLRHANNRCAPSYFMRGLIKMETGDVKGACQDWFTAKHLGHADAEQYLLKYPKIRIKEPLTESLSV